MASKKQSLTQEQRKIVREIKRLYKHGEPLNITAVKRRHPKLLKAVYKIKPFWGWKQALEAAGIRYSSIRIELQDYVVCEICGEEKVNLANHLILKHGVDPQDYLIDYPEARLFSEEFCAYHSKMKSGVLPHWEPLWSPEYVLDRIYEFHIRGQPLSTPWIEAHGSTLCQAAEQHLGGWRNALEAVGIDPETETRNAYRRTRKYPDEASVLREIRRRHHKGQPINYGFISRGSYADRTLLLNAREYFGSWPQALEAVGINPEAVRRRVRQLLRRYPGTEDVIRGIRRRARQKLGINASAVVSGRFRDYALLLSAREYFGSWSKALQAAGFNPDAIQRNLGRRRRKYPDEKSVLRGIRLRHRNKLPLHASGLDHAPNRDGALYRRGKEYFGFWDKALECAGFDPLVIRREVQRKRIRYPDKESVIREVKRRHRLKLPVNRLAVEKGPDRDAALRASAKEYLGSWDKVLKAAGVDS